MKTALQTKKLTFLALIVASLFVGVAFAQASKSLTLSYTIDPTSTVAVTPIQLGSLVGGTQTTLSFLGAIQITAPSGTHSMNATLSIPPNVFSKFLVTLSVGNSNECFLGLNQAPCTWSFSGTSETLDVMVTATPIDGQQSTGVATVTIDEA